MFNSLCKAVKKCREKKGFTLVELIVVLVILAILAALLVPTLTGYIDKANEEKVISEIRMVVMAVQTEASSEYGHAGAGNMITKTTWSSTSDQVKEIIELSEVLKNNSNAKFEATINANGTIVSVNYYNGLYQCSYDGTKNTYGKATKPETAPTYKNEVTVQ